MKRCRIRERCSVTVGLRAAPMMRLQAFRFYSVAFSSATFLLKYIQYSSRSHDPGLCHTIRAPCGRVFSLGI